MSSIWLIVVELLGVVVIYLGLRALVTWFLRQRQFRALLKNVPPKGARPVVKLTHDGVTYDLTDQLMRANDAEDKSAVWIVLGPQHLRFKHGQGINLQVRRPQPAKTNIRFQLITMPSGYARFATRDEVIKDYPELS